MKKVNMVVRVGDGDPMMSLLRHTQALRSYIRVMLDQYGRGPKWFASIVRDCHPGFKAAIDDLRRAIEDGTEQ